MTPDEKREMLAWLENSRAAVLRAVDGVTPEQAVRVPGPGKWSILGCVEHIAISEDYLFSQIVNSTPSDTPLFDALRESRIPVRGADRSRRVESPPEGHPQGRFPTLPNAIQHFLESRERTIQFVEANQDDLRSRITLHPILGTANCHEMLLTMAVHPVRHAKQIEEIRAALE